jgi:hypothetical protein
MTDEQWVAHKAALKDEVEYGVRVSGGFDALRAALEASDICSYRISAYCPNSEDADG